MGPEDLVFKELAEMPARSPNHFEPIDGLGPGNFRFKLFLLNFPPGGTPIVYEASPDRPCNLGAGPKLLVEDGIIPGDLEGPQGGATKVDPDRPNRLETGGHAICEQSMRGFEAAEVPSLSGHNREDLKNKLPGFLSLGTTLESVVDALRGTATTDKALSFNVRRDFGSPVIDGNCSMPFLPD
jgi:hypothetical protein